MAVTTNINATIQFQETSADTTLTAKYKYSKLVTADTDNVDVWFAQVGTAIGSGGVDTYDTSGSLVNALNETGNTMVAARYVIFENLSTTHMATLGIANFNAIVTVSAGAATDNGASKVRITKSNEFVNAKVGMYAICDFASVYTDGTYLITAVEATGDYIDIDLAYSNTATVTTTTVTKGNAGVNASWALGPLEYVIAVNETGEVATLGDITVTGTETKTYTLIVAGNAS